MPSSKTGSVGNPVPPPPVDRTTVAHTPARGSLFSRIVEFAWAWQLPIGIGRAPPARKVREVARSSCGKPGSDLRPAVGLRGIVSGFAAMLICAASADQSWAMGGGARPEIPPHSGDLADSSVWPVTAVGVVTTVFHSDRRTGKILCTGTLVAPDTVLTAAHCLFPAQDLSMPERVHFWVGPDRGASGASSAARRLEISPDFDPQEARTLNAAASDWALVYLRTALSPRPVAVHSPTADDLGAIYAAKSATQIGYGIDRPSAPSIFRNCEIYESPSVRVLVHRCLVNYGYSGAPILADFDGQPAIIAIGSRGREPDINNPQGIACSARSFADRIAQLPQQY